MGHFYPKTGTALKPLGDAFIALIRMMIAPVIFCTVVHGIASMSNLAKVGRVGLKALIYFEVVSTVALAIGLLVGDIVKPGQGFNIDPSALDPHAVAGFAFEGLECLQGRRSRIAVYALVMGTLLVSHFETGMPLLTLLVQSCSCSRLFSS